MLACAAYASYYSIEYERFLWLLYLFVIAAAILGGGALCALFIYRPRPYQGAANTLHKLFSFRLFVSEEVLCVLYACIFCGITAYSVILVFSNVVYAALVFILGNLAVRVVFELVILFIHLCIHVDNIAERFHETASSASSATSSFSEDSPNLTGPAPTETDSPEYNRKANTSPVNPPVGQRPVLPNEAEKAVASASRTETTPEDSLNSIITEALRQAKEDHTDF